MKNIALLLAASAALAVNAANPYLPLWEFIPDGEPYVFEDPDNPGKMRVYIYGSHDTIRTGYCGHDQVVWSAGVDDLKHWRFDGVILRVDKDANGEPIDRLNRGDLLYAPDVALVVGPDGKKTYYLYPNDQNDGRKNLVAKSDRPDGPFEVCNWNAGKPKETVGCMGFDPAVLVDDDGRVYGYWGIEKSYCAELDPTTMATLKPGTQITEGMISHLHEDGPFRFFEASSIRKIKDKYVFIYSRWTKDGEFGMPNSNYTLAYAYSDGPLGPWTYGGTIIDGRARQTRSDGSVRATACPGGNTHGSICEINGRWWVFYHRQTGTDDFSRQAMVAPIEVKVEEGPGGKVEISEGEYTSEGFETEGLNPLERHAAGIACYYVGPEPAVPKYPFVEYPGPYIKTFPSESYWVANPYEDWINKAYMVHITSGSQIGYKYFNMDKTYGNDNLKLEFTFVPKGIDGAMRIFADAPSVEEGGVLLGTYRFTANDPEIQKTATLSASALAIIPDEQQNATLPVSPMAKLKGKHALYFVFASRQNGQSICELRDFKFVQCR